MKNLYFGLMCVLDSILLLIIATVLTVVAYGPLDSFFGAVTMWEDLSVGLLALVIALLIEASTIAIIKAVLEKKNEKAADTK